MKNNTRYIPKIGERVEFAARFVPKVKKLLDIGCGDGVISNFLKGKVDEIYGIDNSSENLEIAKKYGILTSKIDLDKEKTFYKNDFFDVITCLDVIEHIKDPQKLIEEIKRILCINGLLIISTPNIRFSNHLFQLIFKGRFPKTSLDPALYDGGHIHFFTYKDLEELLIINGFKIERTEGIINKRHRGWKGKLIEIILGTRIMHEFRSPGILIIARKI